MQEDQSWEDDNFAMITSTIPDENVFVNEMISSPLLLIASTENSIQYDISSTETFRSGGRIEISLDMTGFHPVAAFLEEAVHIYKHKRDSKKSCRVAIAFLDHAFELVERFQLAGNPKEQHTLTRLKALRAELVGSLEDDTPSEPRLKRSRSNNMNQVTVADSAADVLIAEANATLDLAEAQLAENMREEAGKNFHTATIYFRVLQSKMPLNIGKSHSISMQSNLLIRLR